MRERLRRLVLGSPLALPLRAVKHRLDPAEVRFDRAEQVRMAALVRACLREGGDAVDVGANAGDVLAVMVQASPGGSHAAFEPLPDHAAQLRARFPGVAVHQLALSDVDGDADFAHVITRPGWSGFRARPTPGDDRVEHIRVARARLDDVLGHDAAPVLVKIDVEGAELEVLRGALATLRRARPVVIFEHGLGSADYYGTAPADVWRLLVEDAGLALFDLELSGPYSLERFVAAYERKERVNFAAMTPERRAALTPPAAPTRRRASRSRP